MSIIITVMSGVEDGKVFRLDKAPVTIGRHPDDNVCLPYDTKVSRHHAQIIQEGNFHYIEDIGAEGKGSTNGTFINDNNNRISGKTSLLSGDIVLLGGVWVKFQVR
jgi:pSer/pThr/pTyr-binding forkhead associated (FHA) protein